MVKNMGHLLSKSPNTSVIKGMIGWPGGSPGFAIPVLLAAGLQVAVQRFLHPRKLVCSAKSLMVSRCFRSFFTTV